MQQTAAEKLLDKNKHLQGNFGNEIFDEYIGRETCGRKILEKTSAPKIRRKSMGEKNPEKKYWNQTSAKKLRQQFAANSCREILEKKIKYLETNYRKHGFEEAIRKELLDKKRGKQKHLQGNFGNEIFDEYIGRETCGRKIFEKTSAPKRLEKRLDKHPRKKTVAENLRSRKASKKP